MRDRIPLVAETTNSVVPSDFDVRARSISLANVEGIKRSVN